MSKADGLLAMQDTQELKARVGDRRTNMCVCLCCYNLPNCGGTSPRRGMNTPLAASSHSRASAPSFALRDAICFCSSVVAFLNAACGLAIDRICRDKR